MNMTNRDAAINSTIDHLANVGATFLGFSAGPATKALIKVVANNYIQNSKYEASKIQNYIYPKHDSPLVTFDY